jgi:hypothetical protein
MRLKPDLLTGPKLDAAVAAEVFGLEVMRHSRASLGDVDFSCRAPGEDWHGVPVCGSNSASLTLEAKLAELGW